MRPHTKEQIGRRKKKSRSCIVKFGGEVGSGGRCTADEDLGWKGRSGLGGLAGAPWDIVLFVLCWQLAITFFGFFAFPFLRGRWAGGEEGAEAT